MNRGDRRHDEVVGRLDASRFQTVAIATLDERRLRVLTPLGGEDAYRLLPADRA